MSLPGYYLHIHDMTDWLTMAQCAQVSKNKVRKQLWTEFVDRVVWHRIDPHFYGDHFRVSQTDFVAIQTFCLVDGKGLDSLSSDQLLNWCTTLADLRSKLPVEAFRTVDGRDVNNHLSVRPPVVSSPALARRPVVATSQTSGAHALVAEEVAAQVARAAAESVEEEEQKYSTPRVVPDAPPL